MLRYHDGRAGKARVNLQPGEIYVTGDDEIIDTVLGSCISVCFFDEERGIAGMNHFMLPMRTRGGVFSENAEEGRFGDESLNLLLLKMLRQGANKDRLTAKVFGGAAMISKCCEKNCLSKENAELAYAFLADQNISVVCADTGGSCGRRIYFEVESGQVTVEPLRERGFESCRVIPISQESDGTVSSLCCRKTRRVRKSC